MNVGPVKNSLTQLLHVPRGDGLGVGQLGGKNLDEREADGDFCFIPDKVSENPL